MLRHVSFDLETLGSDRPTAVIVQIGAVIFDANDLEFGGYGEEDRFMVRIDIDDCLRHGLTVDQGALLFWMFQTPEAREKVFKGARELLHPALSKFTAWIDSRATGGECRFWSHATFDPPILLNAYRAVGLNPPMNLRKARDLRTRFEDVWGDKANFPEIPRSGVAHDALDDAIYQADALKASLRASPLPFAAA